MFQNDYDPTSAASSHQTNSALSVHVVRLSYGRLYALFLAFVIFSSWFQLVAQTQTAISLLLLAIIGFLLGKATDDTDDEASHQLANSKHFEAVQVEHSDQDKSAAAGDYRRQKRANSTKHPSNEPGSASSRQSADSSLTDSCEPRSGDDSTSTMDPLIKSANGALNMLKTLSNASSDDEEDINESPQPGEQVLPIMSSKKSIKKATSCRCDNGDNRFTKKQQQQQKLFKNQELRMEKALTSPSALSSTSSTGSTGYNSDTRSANLTRSSPTPLRVVSSSPLIDPNESLKVGRNNSLATDYEEQMIELVRQPTALRLVMDEFSARSSSSCSQPDRYCGELKVSGSQRPPCLRATGSLNGNREEEEDDDEDDEELRADRDEPHYSSPALSFAQRTIELVSLDSEVADGATCEPP